MEKSMTDNITVKKRNGSIQGLDLDKIHAMVDEACKDLTGVSASQVEMASGIQFYDGISTEEIQDILIKSASDLISLDHPNYQYVAARLLLFSIRKKIYGGRIDLPHLNEHIRRCVDIGVYDSVIYDNYTEEELNEANSFIDHDRDLLFTYAAMKELVDKYLVQNRKTNELYETPQFMYMMVALTSFANYPKETRLSYVKRFYDSASRYKINVPTPILAGVRTQKRQYSSCTLLDCGDSMESIIATTSAMFRYVSNKAGIGLNVGRIRGLGSEIRDGEVVHTGVVPFIKAFEGVMNSCSQGGLRKGSATLFFPIWHQEIRELIVLKNEKGNDENRARSLDYAVSTSRLFYERFINNQKITLFSPHDVPGLYDAFGSEEFDELYVRYENDDSIPKEVVDAQELTLEILTERSDTGRLYILNIDHANSHSPYKSIVRMSNLCVAPETQILTKDGYQTISELEDEYVDVWNGEEWSNVQVKKTSDSQELVKVVIDGEYLECTAYHRFFVVSDTNYARSKKFVEKRAYELSPGDKLIKYELPIINGEDELKDAYTLGFHTGDGSYCNGEPIIDLYGEKMQVLEQLNYKKYSKEENNNRIRTYLNIPPHTKYVVPGCEYTIESRLKWFAGLIDSDGHIAKNGNTETIQIVSIHYDFIKNVKYMLHTLGVTSKIMMHSSGGMRPLPDGKGGTKEYYCNPAWRLLISNTGLARLCNLDLHKYVNRVSISYNIPNRNAERFNVVEDIIYTGRKDATYCFSEPKRGMGMFNGFLVGNCMEIALLTEPIEHIDDTNGAIALCILSALNVGTLKSEKELEEHCDIIVRQLDELIDIQEYPVKAAELSARKYRPLGVGIIGLAHYLARNSVKYDDPEAVNLVHRLAESIQYYLLKASNQLAREKGPCEGFSETKYSEGILPIDTYKKSIDDFCSEPLQHDWESLRDDIVKYGLRNTTLTAAMPSEASSKLSNTTNGIEPPRGYLSIKRKTKIIVPQYNKLKNNYTLAWDMKSNEGYFNIVAVIQKFFDQAISANWYYNPEHYPENKVPMSVIVRDFLSSFQKGHKTAYYNNTYDRNEENMELESLVNEILEQGEEDCESCKL
jgi:ribonucleoside-diphosphate reductase alpha chain